MIWHRSWWRRRGWGFLIDGWWATTVDEDREIGNENILGMLTNDKQIWKENDNINGSWNGDEIKNCRRYAEWNI